MPMHEYTFDSAHILQNALRDTYLARVYTTRTTSEAPFSRQQTVLEHQPTSTEAVIDWQAKTFRIGTGAGTTKSVDSLKRSPTFSTSRYWRWGTGEEYKVKYSDGSWTVSSSTGALIASLSSATEHIIRQNLNSLPVLRLARTVADETQRQFLILLLLYSETRRIERQT
ncbi:hypothetical protein MIND_00639000 [Mycena indigotica]|uniref:Uncharacterized protein n=1 Tax=Mycena indigotica TaxID=2126181 RepID=A0A8H6SUB7_9AGAR|nr:uncharacterized protein MIND_00639000 [Mycena indigotica]KAF7304075.1 hypothetical protein MIND_00639000 [Mycena indigotica]